ncbi:PREDICTED: uncharacterized protein LOC106110204 [Papilio polytes]|uniref:uncharacterized protein LOC106110204 n=1 Tax=Papilio polytes TaxID=76194 RepID=UPI000676A06A|nr:PREDICTED: uncharacterized protein LOC106110204 [Papilio polytes]
MSDRGRMHNERHRSRSHGHNSRWSGAAASLDRDRNGSNYHRVRRPIPLRPVNPRNGLRGDVFYEGRENYHPARAPVRRATFYNAGNYMPGLREDDFNGRLQGPQGRQRRSGSAHGARGAFGAGGAYGARPAYGRGAEYDVEDAFGRVPPPPYGAGDAFAAGVAFNTGDACCAEACATTVKCATSNMCATTMCATTTKCVTTNNCVTTILCATTM